MNLKQNLATFIKNTNQIQVFFRLLIIWTLFGFFLRWDNNMFHGCIMGDDRVFALDNIFFSTTSFILLTLGVAFQRINERVWFLFLELFYWLFKLFYLKGGYAVGIAGVPIFTVVFFDMIALCLRIMLMNSSLNFKFSNNYIIIPIIIACYVKFYCFS